MTLSVDRFMLLNRRERRARFGDDDYVQNRRNPNKPAQPHQGPNDAEFKKDLGEMRAALHQDEDDDSEEGPLK